MSVKEESVQQAMQMFFNSEENLITISLSQNGTCAFHYADSGHFSKNPRMAEIIVRAAKDLSELTINE